MKNILQPHPPPGGRPALLPLLLPLLPPLLLPWLLPLLLPKAGGATGMTMGSPVVLLATEYPKKPHPNAPAPMHSKVR